MHGRRREFFQGGHYWIFPKIFLRGAKNSEICFLPLEIKKTAYLLKFSNSCPSTDIHMLCAGKVCAKQLKNMGNFKRFDTIPNNEILLNLIRKMKYLTDQFRLFLHWQHNWHFYGQLAVATYVLPCLCISVDRWRNRLAA